MMKDQAQTDLIDLARSAQTFFKLNEGAAPQLERIVQVQEGIVEEVENFARNWFQRRNDASQNAFKTLNDMNGSSKADPAAVMRAIAEWPRGSFERLSADLQDWTTLCVRCADGAMTTQSDRALDGSGKTTSKAASGAAGKVDGKDASKRNSTGHATPV